MYVYLLLWNYSWCIFLHDSVNTELLNKGNLSYLYLGTTN